MVKKSRNEEYKSDTQGRIVDYELEDVPPKNKQTNKEKKPQNKKAWPWANHISSLNFISQMRTRVMRPTLCVSQGCYGSLSEEAWAKEGTLKRWMCCSGRRWCKLNDRAGSCPSILHFRLLLLQSGMLEMAQLQILGHAWGLLIAPVPAMEKELKYIFMCQFQADSFALEIKRHSWVRWDTWIDPKSTKKSSKCLKHRALRCLNDT